MATQTTNYHLIKPEYADDADIADINTNMDTIDTTLTSQNAAIANTQSGIAYIVGNTNTTGSTLSAGQFVFVKGHSSIAEGLRKVTASISPNGSITTSNTTAVSGGGLNALNSNITTINDKFAWTTFLSASNVSAGNTYASTGKSFTLSAPALVSVSMSYGSGRPLAIGLKGSESAGSSSVALNAVVASDIADTSGLSVTAILPAGTYYIWARTASATGSTSLSVYGMSLGA